MKKFALLLTAALITIAASAQKEKPTVNWPYMYPDFVEGTLENFGGLNETARYNIHLNIATLHYLEDGIIKEHSLAKVKQVTIGDEVYRNIYGKMMLLLGETEGGLVVKEILANYSGIISRDGAYGGAVANRDKTFSHQENNGSFNGYLITDNYADLFAIKNDSDEVPLTTKVYLYINNRLIFANKNSVLESLNIDKKAFSEFLKSNDIKWKNPEDLVKIIDYITGSK